MLIFVTVPHGIGPGDIFEVCCDNGSTVMVECPEDALPGEEIELEVQDASTPTLVEVTVPDGVAPGEQFLVEMSDGSSFWVELPADCAEPAAGLVLSVEVPAPEEDGMKVHPPEEDDGTQQCDDTFSTSDSEDAPHADAPGTAGPSRLARRTLGALQQPAIGRHFHGQGVNVYRTDGTWTRAFVVDHDDAGDTYTVRLPDGRCKYFVQPDDLRASRVGEFEVGRRVALQAAGPWAGRGDARAEEPLLASIEDYDDETGSYTVLREDTQRRQYFVMPDEILTRRQVSELLGY